MIGINGQFKSFQTLGGCVTVPRCATVSLNLKTINGFGGDYNGYGISLVADGKHLDGWSQCADRSEDHREPPEWFRKLQHLSATHDVANHYKALVPMEHVSSWERVISLRDAIVGWLLMAP